MAIIAAAAIAVGCAMNASAADGTEDTATVEQASDETTVDTAVLTVKATATGTTDKTVKMRITGTPTDESAASVDRTVDVKLNDSAGTEVTGLADGTYTLSFSAAPTSTDTAKAFALPKSQTVTVSDGEVTTGATVTFTFTQQDAATAAASSETTGTGDSATTTSTDTATQAQSASSTGSGSSDGGGTDDGGGYTPPASHTEQVWVVDQEAYDEPVYETYGVIVCHQCGAEFDTYDEWCAHSDASADSGGNCCSCHEEARTRQVGTTHHDEVGHYETVTVYD